MRPAVSRLPIVLLLVAAGAVQSCGGAADDRHAPFRPVATVDEVMDAIVIPSAEAIFDAVVYVNGEIAAMPDTDEDWFQLKLHALALAEAGNLLMMAPRARDTGDWMTFSRAMTDGAVLVAEAADARDTDRLLDTGSEMYNACTGCHDLYLDAQ